MLSDRTGLIADLKSDTNTRDNLSLFLALSCRGTELTGSCPLDLINFTNFRDLSSQDFTLFTPHDFTSSTCFTC